MDDIYAADDKLTLLIVSELYSDDEYGIKKTPEGKYYGGPFKLQVK